MIEASSALARSDRRCNRMFIFGMGYVGRYVSEQLKREGWHVSGTCRDAINKRDLDELGLDAFIFEINNNKLRTLSTLLDATHILVSVPPIAGVGDPLLSLHEDLQCSLSYGNLEWLGYLSSTGVYGDCDGGWVDEDCPVNPKMESAKIRLVAEKGWQNLGRELGLSVHVFRLGGIYGLGRRKIYNVVDDDPAPRAEVFAYARGLIEKKWPGVILDSDDGTDSDSLEEDSAGEKRVSNDRIKNKLGVRLVYPTYREGLESIIGSMDIPSSHLCDL